MPHREPPDALLPGTYVLRDADIERIATTVAQTTAKAIKDETPTHDDMQEIAEKAIEHFLERIGVEKVAEFREDILSLRNSRKMREALVEHGIKAVLTVLLGGVCTAIWWAIKGTR